MRENLEPSAAPNPHVLRDISKRDLRHPATGLRAPAPLLLAPIRSRPWSTPTARWRRPVPRPASGCRWSFRPLRRPRWRRSPRRRARRPALVSALTALGPRAGREPGAPGRAGRLLGAGADCGQLDRRLEAARPATGLPAPPLEGIGIAQYLSDPVFRATALAKPPEEDIGAAVGHFLGVFSDPASPGRTSSGCRARPRCRS